MPKGTTPPPLSVHERIATLQQRSAYYYEQNRLYRDSSNDLTAYVACRCAEEAQTLAQKARDLLFTLIKE